MIIAFSGIDGSGKTTYAEFCVNYFKEKKIDCKYRHMVKDSLYNVALHNFIGKISKNTQASIEKGLRNKKNRVRFFLLKLVKKALLVLNMVYFNLAYGSYRGNPRRNIVSDRYFYDDIAQLQYLGLASENFIKFYSQFIMKPDIIFFVKVEPETAFKRKGEYKKEYFFDKCKIYEDVFNQIPMAIHVNKKSKEESLRFISDRIEECLRQR